LFFLNGPTTKTNTDLKYVCLSGVALLLKKTQFIFFIVFCFWIDIKNKFLKIKNIILIYFEIKKTL
jgi:hypothetical protein